MSNDEVFSAGGITNEGLDIIEADIEAGKYAPDAALDLGLLVEEVRRYRAFPYNPTMAVNKPATPSTTITEPTAVAFPAAGCNGWTSLPTGSVPSDASKGEPK